MAKHQIFDGDGNIVEEHYDASFDIAVRGAEISKELSALDVYLPRSVEDICEADPLFLGKLSQPNRDRLARKAALREELRVLDVANTPLP